MRDERARRRQAALFLSALLLVNAPALAVVDRLGFPGSAGGVPLTPVFLFAAWLLLILLCALNAAAAAPSPPSSRTPADAQG